MRFLLASILLFGSMALWTGCGDDRPEPPEGYVDPGTDPGAMGDTLQPNPNETSPATP
jgi:hypothetical protein